jgi:signal peptidase I
MKQGITQPIRGDRLGLTDLLEISDLLLRNQAISLRVAGWSMYPVLWKGDQLTVEPASPTSLLVGDAILFHQCGQLICHRVVAIDTTGPGTRIITKGDAATGCGETIQPEQVLGRVVAVTRRWPWARTSGWVGAQAMRIHLTRERLIHLIAQGLQYLQGLRAYRWIIRSVLSHSFAFYHGVPEGSQWIRYQPISRGGDATLPTGHRDFHLLAKLGETCVGSLQCKAGAEGYRIDDLYVRIRFRGMGVGSQLLALAATTAAVSGARVLLASVEPANTAALHLFTKMGFRKTGGLHGTEVSLRRDL